jgi:hypothetical protein
MDVAPNVAARMGVNGLDTGCCDWEGCYAEGGRYLYGLIKLKSDCIKCYFRLQTRALSQVKSSGQPDIFFRAKELSAWLYLIAAGTTLPFSFITLNFHRMRMLIHTPSLHPGYAPSQPM